MGEEYDLSRVVGAVVVWLESVVGCCGVVAEVFVSWLWSRAEEAADVPGVARSGVSLPPNPP